MTALLAPPPSQLQSLQPQQQQHHYICDDASSPSHTLSHRFRRAVCRSDLSLAKRLAAQAFALSQPAAALAIVGDPDEDHADPHTLPDVLSDAAADEVDSRRPSGQTVTGTQLLLRTSGQGTERGGGFSHRFGSGPLSALSGTGSFLQAVSAAPPQTVRQRALIRQRALAQRPFDIRNIDTETAVATAAGAAAPTGGANGASIGAGGGSAAVAGPAGTSPHHLPLSTAHSAGIGLGSYTNGSQTNSHFLGISSNSGSPGSLADERKSSLALAISHNADLSMIQWLLDMGHEANGLSRDADNNSIVTLAALENRADVIELYVSHPSTSAISASAAGETESEQDREGDQDWRGVEGLLDWSNDSLGQTALHLASVKGHEDVIRLLLDLGAEIDLPDREGNTALHL